MEIQDYVTNASSEDHENLESLIEHGFCEVDATTTTTTGLKTATETIETTSNSASSPKYLFSLFFLFFKILNRI